MSLAILVVQEKWQEFEQSWQTMRDTEGPIAELLTALKLLGDKKRIARWVKPAREHARELCELDRVGDAACILGEALVAGGNPAELNEDLRRYVDSAWSQETWFGPYSELSGMVEGAAELRGPWRALAKLRAFQEGTLVYHPGGWGAGEILEVDATLLHLKVRFASGKSDTFPMNAAIDIFEPLPETDVRARHLRDQEGVRKQAKQDPLEVLRWVVTSHHGKASTALIRNAMMQIGIEGSAWSAWWRKVRKQAENSEWFEVTGTPQKSVVSLLLKAKDPLEALQKQLTRAGGLGEVHAKIRDLFVGDRPDEAVLEVGLKALEEQAQLDSEPLEERLAAWLLLRDLHKESPPIMLEVLNEVLAAPSPSDPSEAPPLWALFQALPSVRDQERAVDILPELFGDKWLDVVAPHLPHAASGQIRLLVDRFVKDGRSEVLRKHYSVLLARPLRAPLLMVTLAGLFEDGTLEDGFPNPFQRAQALLNLATYLQANRRGNPYLTRVCTRLTDLLAKGKQPLLRRLMEGADAPALRSVCVTVQRGVEAEIDHMVTEIALDFDRHFFAGQSGSFWETDAILTTKKGMVRRSAELRELTEVKIPANQDAIGVAAAYGDLSENSEWEAAMEEQRNLTSRAMAMEEELRNTGLIEEAAIPEDTACPGTIVQYRETDSGQEHRMILLGPWDEDAWNGIQVVSYRAPLAQGLMGLHSGDTAVLELPAGELNIEVLSIEVPDLE